MIESQNVEWKESWHDEYLKWICGFANAQGGKIYIGVRDDGKVVGVKNIEKLLEDIPNKIQNKLGIVADVNLLTKDGVEYIEIVVNPWSYPVNLDGEYHYRSGSTKQLLRGNALTHFLMTKTDLRWDSATVDKIKIEDLDKESFDIFRREALRSGRMSKEDLDISNEELLEKLDLVVDGKLRRAGVLCFYRNPEKVVSDCYVKIGKFEGSELLYQDEVHGSLIIMADRVIDLIYLKYLKAAISYHKETRVETYPFARDAVREAVYNALIHCNWMESVPIQIRIEDDVMFVSNCSLLPFGWTAEMLLKSHTSKPFNPNVARVFYRAGYIESWGRGIQKIIEACKNIGANEPEYLVTGSDIMVKFTALESALIKDTVREIKNIEKESDEVTDSKLLDTLIKGLNNVLDDGEEKELHLSVIKMIIKNPRITQKEMAFETQNTWKRIQHVMSNLQKARIIERKGGRRLGYWEIVKSK